MRWLATVFRETSYRRGRVTVVPDVTVSKRAAQQDGRRRSSLVLQFGRNARNIWANDNRWRKGVLMGIEHGVKGQGWKVTWTKQKVQSRRPISVCATCIRLELLCLWPKTCSVFPHAQLQDWTRCLVSHFFGQRYGPALPGFPKKASRIRKVWSARRLCVPQPRASRIV